MKLNNKERLLVKSVVILKILFVRMWDVWRNFVDMNTMRNHKVLQHEVTNSPIPKIEGTDDDDNVDDKVYELKIEAHDIIEAKEVTFDGI